MIYVLSVPGSFEDVVEFRVLEWHGSAGHTFDAGDMVVELETHKVVIEVRAERAAVLRRIMAEPGEWLPIGAPLGLLSDTVDEDLPETAEGLASPFVQFDIV